MTRSARWHVSRVPVTGMAVVSGPVPVRAVAVTHMRCLRKTAQSHDAEANTAERQTERVGVHGWN